MPAKGTRISDPKFAVRQNQQTDPINTVLCFTVAKQVNRLKRKVKEATRNPKFYGIGVMVYQTEHEPFKLILA